MMYRVLVEVFVDERNGLSAEGLVAEWLSTAPGVMVVNPKGATPLFDQRSRA